MFLTVTKHIFVDLSLDIPLSLIKTLRENSKMILRVEDLEGENCIMMTIIGTKIINTAATVDSYQLANL